jgi:hypothetical protein
MSTLPHNHPDEPELVGLDELPAAPTTTNGRRRVRPPRDPEDVLPEEIRACLVSEAELADRPRVKHVQGRIAIRRPSREDFIRVHATWRHSVHMYFSEREREGYLVAETMVGRLERVRPVELRPYVTAKDVFAFWPTRLPDNGTDYSWWESERECAELAVTTWLRVVPNLGNEAYDHPEATFTKEPAWPPESFGGLLQRAVSHRIIKDDTHAVLQQLRGE